LAALIFNNRAVSRTPRPSSIQGGHHPIADHRPLELAEHAQHAEQGATAWRRDLAGGYALAAPARVRPRLSILAAVSMKSLHALPPQQAVHGSAGSDHRSWYRP
jgi:hypothetical protein